MNRKLCSIFLVSASFGIISCDSGSSDTPDNLQNLTNSTEIEVEAEPEPILLTPNENDRFSQITGIKSEQSQIVSSTTETISEDARYVATFTIRETAYVNVQVENNSNTTAETLTLDEENYNKYLTGQAHETIEELSFTPLASSFSSEWTLLSPGRYNTVVDNTDRGPVDPPWNGVNDRVTFDLSILASPQYDNSSSVLFNDFADGSENGIAELIQTSTIQVIENEGF